MKTPLSFYSEGVRLDGDVYSPDGLGPRERRAGIVLCHGYTGVKDIYLPDNARVLNEAGYARGRAVAWRRTAARPTCRRHFAGRLSSDATPSRHR